MFIAPSKTIKRHICIVCEDRFETQHANSVCCSDKCKRKRKSELQGVRNKSNPPKNTYKKKPQTKRICAVCEEEFMSSHYSKRTCGPKCARKLQDNSARVIQSKMKKSPDGTRGKEVKVKGIPKVFLERGHIRYRGLTI